ncbi:protein kinase cGMP-dependent 2 L homeolog isoform X2 [Xenopus laevis]|uniref:cGMP-dependent protein kinase n=1 Tax=Xenopus laevis TaxID=8355 RepID=A0A8J0UC51_XENLA|nr:protein kinase cGMP-dependent 2 L homeolog isoform X2 [Xenopus laevis]
MRSTGEMGNGSMKSKPPKQPDGQLVNFSINSCNKLRNADTVKNKVWELERELKKKDEKLKNKEQIFQELQEQINKQNKVIEEMAEELRNKCVQLNKLQDVVKIQGSNFSSLDVQTCPTKILHALPPKSLQGSPLKTISGLFSNSSKRKGAKEGVSAEPTSRYDGGDHQRFSLEKACVRKNTSEKILISDALNKNQFTKRMDNHQIQDMVECMYERIYLQGEFIIRQGEPGSQIFVLADGKAEVFQDSKLLTSIPVWTTFGELAILYNCTRTASVKAITNVRTWALDREVFQNIMRKTAQSKHEEYLRFLKSVSLLKKLPDHKLMKIADCLELEYYETGDYIIREGEEGSTFFIIAKGKVKVTQSAEGYEEPQYIKLLEKGDYFGEKALISDDVRSANILAYGERVECLVMDRETFNKTVGTYEELMKCLEGYVANLTLDDERRHAKNSVNEQHLKAESMELNQMKKVFARFPSASPFENLEIVTTLGVGGFGRVELVKVKYENLVFAMKCIKKRHIVDNMQQEHIHSEKNILKEACSPFIVKLYCTFKDNKYVYMLLEACLGGELWSILRDRGSFDETTAKFCTGCVTEALEYLHQIGVLYRDLKPENLLLDSEGYVKLVDFGFAKKVFPAQKTWTFCGTPEYVAPEVILNKGHSFSVDFWSLGILLYELLTGNPPFTGPDQMIIYNLILQGIEKIEFCKNITKRPEDLICRLCRQNPAERLGYMKNGIADIKKHRWFNGFNWEGLNTRSLPSPLKPKLKGPTDHSHFDIYPPDEEIPPDELSGWDQDF